MWKQEIKGKTTGLLGGRASGKTNGPAFQGSRSVPFWGWTESFSFIFYFENDALS
jgi:hypothetical protein